MRRSQAHAELLVEEFELGMLWDEYGLVGDIVVCIIFFTSPLSLVSHMFKKLVPLGLLAYSRGRYMHYARLHKVGHFQLFRH